MSRLLMSEQMRKRLTYAAMSLLLAWHALAMVVATAPDSEITGSARSLFHWYLTLLRLDNNWGFFAPNIPKGFQFRYVIQDAAGKSHTFVPDEKLSRLNPTAIWFKDRHKVIMESPETYGDAAAAALCREHAALHPVTITLLEAQQSDFWPTDRLSGKHPLDSEFVTVDVLNVSQCPDK